VHVQHMRQQWKQGLLESFRLARFADIKAPQPRCRDPNTSDALFADEVGIRTSWSGW